MHHSLIGKRDSVWHNLMCTFIAVAQRQSCACSCESLFLCCIVCMWVLRYHLRPGCMTGDYRVFNAPALLVPATAGILHIHFVTAVLIQTERASSGTQNSDLPAEVRPSHNRYKLPAARRSCRKQDARTARINLSSAIFRSSRHVCDD